MSPPTDCHRLMARFAEVRDQLAEIGIRDSSDYAEVLVADALYGERVENSVNQGYDTLSPEYGRIEVKCRRLPTDGRIEERVDVKGTKEGGFDYLAIVIFRPDYDVKGTVLIPYDEVWPIVESQAYRRLSYSEAKQLSGAIDITESVRRVTR